MKQWHIVPPAQNPIRHEVRTQWICACAGLRGCDRFKAGAGLVLCLHPCAWPCRSSREFHVEPLAIKELRGKLGLSQPKFAKLLYADVGTLGRARAHGARQGAPHRHPARPDARAAGAGRVVLIVTIIAVAIPVIVMAMIAIVAMVIAKTLAAGGRHGLSSSGGHAVVNPYLSQTVSRGGVRANCETRGSGAPPPLGAGAPGWP